MSCKWVTYIVYWVCIWDCIADCDNTEERMNAILKALVLPFLLVFPIALLRIDNDLSIKEIVASQPLFLVLLLPGLMIAAQQIVKGFWGQSSSSKR